MRILLVEDHDDSRFTAAWLLQHYGHDVDVAASGNEAIACLEQHVPDVVLTDIAMPGMSGTEFALYVHSRWPHIKLIAVTGVHNPNLMKEAAFCAVVVKPFDWPSLQATIAKVVCQQSGTPTD